MPSKWVWTVIIGAGAIGAILWVIDPDDSIFWRVAVIAQIIAFAVDAILTKWGHPLDLTRG